jgi:hypothetical protein
MALPIVTYHSGPLLANVQVEAIFLGWNAVNGGNALQQNEYNFISNMGGNVDMNAPNVPANIPANPNGFFPTILPSSYITSLGQYSAGGFNIGAGAYLGGFATSGNPFSTQIVPGFGPTIYDSQIQSLLQQIIALPGAVPAPIPNILYVIFTQPGMSVIWDTQTGSPFYNASNPTSSVFGAYHFDTTAGGVTASYTVEPSYLVNDDPVNSPKFQALGDFATNTIVLGHEIGEAITDLAPINNVMINGVPTNTYPLGTLPTGWFYKNGGGEIGDLAASFPPIDFLAANAVDDYWVAQLWSNVVLQSNAPHVLLPAAGIPPLPGQPSKNAQATMPYKKFSPTPTAAAPTPQPQTPTPLGLAGNPQPSLAVSPFNSLDLAVASQNSLKISTNGGSSFGQAFAFPIAGDGDSSTVYDKSGKLYWADVNASGGISLSVRNPSTGAAVGNPYTVDTPPAGFTDSNVFLAADDPNDSPLENSLYLTWTRLGPANSSAIFVSRSSNGGQTWSSPLQISAAGDGYVWGSTVSVAPNGDAFVAYHSQPGFTVTSDGGIVPNGTGQTYVVGYSNSLATQLSKTLAFTSGQSDVPTNLQTGSRTIPGMTFLTQGSWTPYVMADPARPGYIYVVAANDPNLNVPGNVDHSNVVLATSTDNGQTWTTSTVESGTTSSQLFPNATIDSNGDILLSWYSNQRGLTDAQGDYELDTYSAYSANGGQSWSAPVQMDIQVFDPNPGAANAYNGPPATTSIGNSFGVALADGSAYVAYVGNTFSGSTATGQQVFFNSFAVPGSLVIFGTNASSTIHIVRMAPGSPIDEVFLNNTLIFTGSLSSITGGIQVVRGDDVDTFGENPSTVGAVTVFLDYSNGDPVPTGGVQFEGAGNETNTIEVNANANYTLSDTSLTIATATTTDTVALSEVGLANLTGGSSSNTFTLSNWTGTATINGAGGTVIVAAGTVLASHLNLSNIPLLQVMGGTFQVDTNFNVATVQVQSGGTLALQNQETLTAGVTNSGNVSPLGAATIAGSYVQTSGGTLDIGIGGTTPGTGYDQLNITGSATLAGTLNVSLINGWAPSSGDVYQILTYASETGDFSTKNFPTLGGGLAFFPDLEATFYNLDVH